MPDEVLASEIEAFIQAFRAVGNGDIADETSRKLKECVKATMILEKKSTLTIKLDIGKIADDQISMVGTVSAKIPETQIKTGFFVNDRTFLPSRNRPNQQTLPGVK
jgi:aspartate ammonia-lyase